MILINVGASLREWNGITFVDFYTTFTWQNEWQEHLFFCC